jgi:hypothetical protein
MLLKDEIKELSFMFKNNYFLIFNENVSFVNLNLKNNELLDIYAIILELYEDFFIFFITSSLLLLIFMLAAVDLIVPLKN